MGYRHYFYKVDKDTLNKINSFSYDEFFKWGSENNLVDIDDEDPYLPLYKIGEKFFEFGKYYENCDGIFESGNSLFQDEKLQDRYEEYVPYIVGKEAVLSAIEHQTKLIIEYYENMLNLTDEERYERHFDRRSKEDMFKNHIESMYHEWKNPYFKGMISAIDVNESNHAITTSWKYEYSIFELVRLYKSTDWEKYGLIFMGW